MNKQPEALRLADALDDGTYLLSQERDATAAELRRLHEENSALRREVAALSANALDDYKMIQSLMAERQPLTDEEINEIADEFIVNYRIPAGSHYDFARAIEAAHGIKEKNI